MRSYEAARGLFSFLGFCSWVVIVVGALVAFGGATAGSAFGRNAGAMQALIAAAPGIILAMAGFYGLALVQLGRAGVDSAEYSQQMLDVARRQLEVSQQSLNQGKQLLASYVMSRAKPTTAETDTKGDEAAASYANRAPEPDQATPTRDPASIEQKAAPAALPEPRKETNVSELLGNKATVAGRELELVNGTYRYGSMQFSTLEKAETYFRSAGVNSVAKTRVT